MSFQSGFIHKTWNWMSNKSVASRESVYHIFPLVAQASSEARIVVVRDCKLVRLDLFALVTEKGNHQDPGETGPSFWFILIFWQSKSICLTGPTGPHILSCDNSPGRLPANQPGLTGDRSFGFDIQDKLGESDSKSGDRVSNLSVTHIWPVISRIRLNLSKRAKAEAKVDFRPEHRSCRKENL